MPVNPKTILIINRTFPPTIGATGRLACDLALYLRKKGHNITVITCGHENKLDEAKRLKVLRIKTPSSRFPLFDIWRTNRLIEKTAKKLPDHDTVISLTDPPLLAITAQKIAQRMGANHLHWCMDVYPDLFDVVEIKLPGFLKDHIQAKMICALKTCSKIIAISPCMARHISHKGIERKKIEIIENWAEGSFIREDKTDIHIPGFEDRKFRILYAGTIGHIHDIDTVLKAAKIIQRKTKDVEFIFTSRGRMAETFKNKVQNLKLKNVRIIPPQPFKYLSSLQELGDIHLVTMKKEASGMVCPSKFYSAVRAKRPIAFIGSDQSHLHKIIIENKCGLSVRNGDSKKLALGILTYLNNGNLWHAHAQSISQLYSNAPQAQMAQWEGLLAADLVF